VAVAGSFNGWVADQCQLAQDGGGYWSAAVDGVRAGDEYKFVVTADGGDALWRSDPYARAMTNSAGNSIVYTDEFDWAGDAFRIAPWNELVIYELHIGTFNDDPGHKPGNFDSIIAKLDYLRDLGVNAIEVMPAMEFATDFSWGYNPAHIFAIESGYGGPRALQELVKAAHARGIAVFFDVVYNHLGPSDLDLWRFDGWSEQGKGGIYFYNDWRSETDWGETRPDYGRGEVRQFLRDNALMWLEDFRMDGLRWDMTVFIRNVYGDEGNRGADLPDGWSLMQRITREAADRHPGKLMIAEDMRGNAAITAHESLGGAGFGTQWDDGFVHTIRRALIQPSDEDRDMSAIAWAIGRRFSDDVFRRVIYTESHDEVANGKSRVPEEVWPGNAGSWASRKRSTLAAALVLTAPGIPMLFQGQEFVEDGSFRDYDPVDWAKSEHFAGVLELYRALVRLRRNWYDTTRGLRGQFINVFHVNHEAKVVAFHRWANGGPRDDVVVLANCANRAFDSYTIGVPRGGWWRVRLNSDWSGFSPDFANQQSFDALADGDGRDGLAGSANVGLGAYSAVILSQDE
jgi:1,4-alpha-glucan branching enzyme